MINMTIVELLELTLKLQEEIKLDIEDVKNAQHEKLLERNNSKIDSMDKLSALKEQLNSELTQEFQSGKDVTIYKQNIDKLENELRHLYYLNGKLGSIVLPVKEMYKEIIDEITSANGGSLVEVRA
jgi:NAD-dependent SIR2 family protein deacetylase